MKLNKNFNLSISINVKKEVFTRERFRAVSNIAKKSHSNVNYGTNSSGTRNNAIQFFQTLVVDGSEHLK